MEKHGRLGQCIEELQQMLQTPINPYNSAGRVIEPSSKTTKFTQKHEPSEEDDDAGVEGCVRGGDGEEESSDSPCSSPSPSHSVGSDLDELLVKECSHGDLPGLITRTSGKGKESNKDRGGGGKGQGRRIVRTGEEGGKDRGRSVGTGEEGRDRGEDGKDRGGGG